MPKRGVNIHENEVVRMFKTVNDSYIEPVSFIVPRRAEVFQDDIYPPTTGIRPAVSGKEWFGGKDGLPPKIDMASLYEGEGIKEVPSDALPAAPKPASPVKAEVPKKEPEPAAPVPAISISSSRGDAAKEQSASMAAAASKYADSEKDDAEETSDFEVVSKPTESVPPKISLSPATDVEPPAVSPPGLWKAAKPEPVPSLPTLDKV
jgi:coronin-1B/1C/6